MEIKKTVVRIAGIGGVLGVASTGLAAAPAGAAYDGCFEGQVGYYTQANGAGTCYGFAGTNNSLGSWGINDKIRSGKNIGTSGNRARLYQNIGGEGGMAMCLTQYAQMNNPNAPQGASNDWGGVCTNFTNHWGVYVK